MPGPSQNSFNMWPISAVGGVLIKNIVGNRTLTDAGDAANLGLSTYGFVQGVTAAAAAPTWGGVAYGVARAAASAKAFYYTYNKRNTPIYRRPNTGYSLAYQNYKRGRYSARYNAPWIERHSYHQGRRYWYNKRYRKFRKWHYRNYGNAPY